MLYKAAKWLAGMKKKSCLKCFCAHLHCPQYKDTECVWEEDERETVKERGTDTETQISTEGKKETERRKKQAAGRKEYCVMLIRERKITLQRQEHKESTTNSGAQQ